MVHLIYQVNTQQMLLMAEGWTRITDLHSEFDFLVESQDMVWMLPSNAMIKILTICYTWAAMIGYRKLARVHERYMYPSKSSTLFTSFLLWATPFPHNFKLILLYTYPFCPALKNDLSQTHTFMRMCVPMLEMIQLRSYWKPSTVSSSS